MEKLTGSKLGKEYDKPEYCHPFYLTYMQSTSCEMPDWMTAWLERTQAEVLQSSWAGLKLARKNINNLGYVDDATLMEEGGEELKSFLMKVKEEREKAGLKLNILKTKIMTSGPQNVKMWKQWQILFFGPPNHCKLQPCN